MSNLSGEKLLVGGLITTVTLFGLAMQLNKEIAAFGSIQFIRDTAHPDEDADAMCDLDDMDPRSPNTPQELSFTQALQYHCPELAPEGQIMDRNGLLQRAHHNLNAMRSVPPDKVFWIMKYLAEGSWDDLSIQLADMPAAMSLSDRRHLVTALLAYSVIHAADIFQSCESFILRVVDPTSVEGFYPYLAHPNEKVRDVALEAMFRGDMINFVSADGSVQDIPGVPLDWRLKRQARLLEVGHNRFPRLRLEIVMDFLRTSSIPRHVEGVSTDAARVRSANLLRNIETRLPGDTLAALVEAIKLPGWLLRSHANQLVFLMKSGDPPTRQLAYQALAKGLGLNLNDPRAPTRVELLYLVKTQGDQRLLEIQAVDDGH